MTDNFDTNAFGEIGLATGDHQLVQPTDVANPTTDPAGVAAVQADNAARGVVLDDGSSISFLNNANKGIPLPWLATDNPVRIGSPATLHQPVILEFRNSAWDFQPTTPVTDEGADVATFGDTRAANEAPQAVGGDLRLATFNVENFFPTSAADYDRARPRQHVHVVRRPRRYADHGQPVHTQRPARRLGRHQPPAPAGQGDPGDQQPRRRRDVAGGDRELRAVRQGPRRRPRAARRRAQRRRRHDPLGLRPVARPGRPAAHRRAGRDPHGVHLQPRHGRSRSAPRSSCPTSRTRASRSPTHASRWPRSSSARAPSTPTASWWWSTTSSRRATARLPATGDNANGIQGAFNGDRVRQAQALVDFAQPGRRRAGHPEGLPRG